MKNLDLNNIIYNLLSWFSKNSRDLEFRKDKDPYKIMVSEVMAQQTQITTLLPYFTNFIERFPTINSLATSSEEEVLKYWEGLGYYRRAKNLRKAAIIINNSKFPDNFKDLLKLPGIGNYTAGAIASIAFNEKVPSIDGNTIRVITRLFGIKDQVDKKSTKDQIKINIEKLIDILPQNEIGNFNQSLMEMGALICTKNNPKCLICPIKENCLALSNELVESIPNKSKQKKKEIENYDVLILNYKGNLLFEKRENFTLLNNLYGFPMLNNNNELGSRVNDFKEKYDLNTIKPIGKSNHVFTHKIWNSYILYSEINYIPKDLTTDVKTIPTAFKKMIDVYNKRN